ncbi:MAG: hypothetical protein P8J27_17140, partial [Mariniblastus sp.]|nr:hypothetical protein [Mariniblastus sp.]
MKNLRTVVLPAVALVIFCISLKNSFLVASNSERTTAVCTSIEKPTKRTRRSRSRGFNPLRSSEYKFRFTSKDGQ